MKKLLFLSSSFLAVICVISFTSCKKKGCTNEQAENYDADAKKDDNTCVYGDTTRPVITINEPSKAEYMFDTATMQGVIPISIDVEDEGELHEVKIVLTNTTDGVEALHIHLHPDETTASIDTSYTATMGHRDYELVITATDHEENTATKTAETHVHME